MKRFIAAIAAATGVTFGLFFIMQGLITFEDVSLNEGKQFKFIDVVQDIQDQPPQRMERKVEKPPEVETPPPELDTPEIEIADPNAMNLNVSRSNVNKGVDMGSIDLGPSQDGDYLPLVRVQPQYPRRAQERGVEGYVIVELTVNEDGTVPTDSIVVLEADPKGYFERAAIKAASKFKYKPKVVNGKGIPVTGVRYKFTFDLAD